MGIERLYKRGSKLDGRNRVVIPSELLEELKIKSNECVCVYADFEDNKIVIRKEVKK